MIETIIIGLVVVLVASIVSKSDVHITITHKYTEVAHEYTQGINTTQDALDKEQDDGGATNFDEVIKTINAEFGGVDVE